MSCIGHDITLVSQPGQTVLTDHPELYMNSKNDFLWQMPLWHVLFFMPEVRGLRRGQAPLPEMGSGPIVRGGVRHFARDGVRPLCPRWGQAPLSEMGSGTSACGGVRHFAREAGSGTLARDGVRHLCLRRGLTPEGIVTYLHLRFILRCFIIVGAGGSTNIA